MFCDILKKLRMEANLTQHELADKLNISRSSLSLYEIGKREPDYELLKSISKFFGVSTDFLLGNNLGDVDGLSDESRKELEQYINLLKIRDMYKQDSDGKVNNY